MYADFDLTETIEPVEDDIPTVAQGTGVHTALVAAVIQAGLLETLQGDGPFTVFAPTDDAFLAAGVDLSALDNDEGKAALTNILLYHVVSGSVMSSEVTDGMTATAINGDTLTFSVGDSVMVNDATVTIADVTASNGVVHVIDKVLMPPVPGEICYDMATHTVDVTKTVETCDKSWIPSVDIPMTAAATTIHSSLVAALDKANLTATLKGAGPFTVFAPTDEAFAAAGIDLAEFDTDEEISSLADILTYHVVSGKVMSSDLTDGMEAKAINGDVLKFMIGENVTVNSATITIADVPVSNGIIHVIDKVLMPPADELEPEQPTCDFTVGLDSSGYAFSPASISIEVGDTVCWQWTDSMDSHNVAEISNEGDVTRKEGGIYSGAVATTVDFRHTFEEATTFYYICEPHVSMEMVGKVIVGDGGATTDIVDETEEVEDEESSTPSIGLLAGIVAMLGVALVARKL